MQENEFVAPCVTLYFPTEHGEQMFVPGVDQNPRLQQVPAPLLLYVKAAQGEGTDVPGKEQLVLGGHGRQLDSNAAPCVVLYFPMEQKEQLDAKGIMLYLPAKQAVQG